MWPKPDPSLVDHVERLYSNALNAYRANPVLVEQDANHEENIRVGGYSERTLMELVQNAADALKGAGERGRVEIVLTDDALYCANEGREFSSRGVEAVSHAFLSVKQGDEIGRFGLGFKSVLAVTDAPQVLSRSVSFAFNTERSVADIQSVVGSHRPVPKLRTPVAIDPERVFEEDPVARELGTWATTIVKMPGVKIAEQILRELRDFRSEFLLFVGAVKEIRLRSTRGGDLIDVSHVSRELGDDRVRIESPDGSGQDWFVLHRMHRPSARAKEDVGQAVSRNEIQISVAAPVNRSQALRGRFWSYFPLQDETTASALFNAPWSVNDDRTTLLPKEYNREILRAHADLFVDLLPRLRAAHDPALHLDYMPARGREALGFGDELLSEAIPRVAAKRPNVPGVDGELQLGSEFTPIAFEALGFGLDFGSLIEARTAAMGTQSKDPHHSAYQSQTRKTRLQDLFAYELDDAFAVKRADRDKLLSSVPTTGIASWLTQWALVSHEGAANALRVAAELRLKVPDVLEARVVPLADGTMARLSDTRTVHLPSAEHRDEPGFIAPDFVRIDGILPLLQAAGFRELTPAVRLEHLVAAAEDDPEAWAKIWEVVLDLRPGEAIRAISAVPRTALVPTMDGGWARADAVWDVPELAVTRPDLCLDRTRCLQAVAVRLGVADRVQDDYSVAAEPRWDEYVRASISALNLGLGPGERSVSDLEIHDGFGPGPFSVLAELEPDSRAVVQWSKDLLSTRSPGIWQVDDAASNRMFEIEAPHIWAVRQWGKLPTVLGPVPVDGAVSPLLSKYDKALPVALLDLARTKQLRLPESLDEVGDSIWRRYLASPLDSSVPDDMLTELTLRAVRALGSEAARRLPARVGRAIEITNASSVFLARDAEQAAFLRGRQLPHLHAEDTELADELRTRVPLRSFSDAFSFEIVVEGEHEAQLVLDVYPGLRDEFFAAQLAGVEIMRVDRLWKRVTTPDDGAEDQPLTSALQGRRVLVVAHGSRQDVFFALRDHFGLPIEESDIDRLEKADVEQNAQRLRASARVASTDAERLEVLFGEDDLREKLPYGLWDAVRSFGADDASVGQLLLDAYGQSTLKMLRDLFERDGFSDMPQQMAGSPAAVNWVEKFGFDPSLAGARGMPSLPAQEIIAGRPMLTDLHDFQAQAAAEIRQVLLSGRGEGPAQKAMVELPTGAGKTRTAVESILRAFEAGEFVGPVLWIAQTEELCEQAVQTWSEVWRWIASPEPLAISRLWGDRVVDEPEAHLSVIVATDAKLSRVLDDPDYAWLRRATAVVIDEAHVAGNSKEYTAILERFGIAGRGFERPLLGLSATPFKGESRDATRALVNRFGAKKIQPLGDDPHDALVKRGVLARVQHRVLDGADVELRPSELSQAQNLGRFGGEVLERVGKDQRRLTTLVEDILSLDPEWPVLVFTPSVLSAQTTAAVLKNRGVAAASVSGQTPVPERREQIRRFRAGHLRVLVNCDLLTQGFDAPGIRALYVARPTMSPNRYIQMVGRGLRGPRNGGKEECLIVDMKDNFGALNRGLAFTEFNDLWAS